MIRRKGPSLRPVLGGILACLAAAAVLSCASPGGDAAGRIVDHDLLDGLLRDHVKLGRVDYAGIRKDPRLAAYVAALAKGHPSPREGPMGHMAYWINAYNAFVLQAVAARYPLASVRDIGSLGGAVGGLFRSIKFSIGGQAYTLDTIEHKILRPEFKDPRIHFALCPGTAGGPRLRSSAYHAASLDRELNEAARAFIDDPSKVRLIRSERVLELSPIFDWYADDFSRHTGSVVGYLKAYLPPADETYLSYAKVRIRYTDYDWSLNDLAAEASSE